MLGKKDSFIEVNRVMLSAENRYLQSYTALRSFMPAHRLFTHASAKTHCKVRETDTYTDTHTYTKSLSKGHATRKTRRAGWQEIRAEVSDGLKETQPKRRKHQW